MSSQDEMEKELYCAIKALEAYNKQIDYYYTNNMPSSLFDAYTEAKSLVNLYMKNGKLSLRSCHTISHAWMSEYRRRGCAKNLA